MRLESYASTETLIKCTEVVKEMMIQVVTIIGQYSPATPAALRGWKKEVNNCRSVKQRKPGSIPRGAHHKLR